MTLSEQFAIDEWLWTYPKDKSFEDILCLLLDPDNESIVPSPQADNMSRLDLANYISGTETHFYGVMHKLNQANIAS